MKKADLGKLEALKAVIASRKSLVGAIVDRGLGRDPTPSECPVCGGPGFDVLRVQSVDGDIWRLVACDACGPEQGGLSLALPLHSACADLVPGEVCRTAMLDQGDDDLRWKATEALLGEVNEDAASEAFEAALNEVESEDRRASLEEWIGGGLGPYAGEFYASEIFADWPDNTNWRVLFVCNADRFSHPGTDGEVCIAVVNRASGRGVWRVL